jgi:hypothetical protein
METALIESEGRGYALDVELISSGDEPVPVSGVFLSRKGINAFPEFAEGFGFDTSDIIEGMPPEHYQFRVEMLAAHQGNLIYGDGKSEFRLPPDKKVRFKMPIPFQGIQYFLNAPEDDLFIATTSLTEEGQIVEVEGLQEVLKKSFEQHADLGMAINVNISINVPSRRPVSEETMSKVGTTNPKPVKPMPNN